ncbi:MAG: hypothetical protein DCC49_05375 [Acidobacteria bacterium]|nr:MAG: hypothetical protein DCC49_05375 [Acidobacteriota bacterium]
MGSMKSILLTGGSVAGFYLAWRYLTDRKNHGKAIVFAGIGAGSLGILLLGPFGLVGLFGPAALYRLIRWRQKTRMARERYACTPEAFEALADAVRAKGSLRLAIAELAQSGPVPARASFLSVQTQLEAGVDLASAVGSLSDELGSDEAREAVLAMRLHLASGGNLAESLELVAERARDGLSVERELIAMTAQGRMSGLVMALSAPGFALLTQSIGLGGGFLIRNPVGMFVLVAGLTLDLCGYLWMRKICEVRW